MATIVAEDRSFFAHDGVDRWAIVRGTLQNLEAGRVVSGASTITQQLVKLLDNGGAPSSRNLRVKIREAARAQNLEAQLDKDAILGAYLDRLPYGHGLIGPEAAARGYFGVASRDLSWAQAAFLAVLPRAPTHLDPYRHPERVISRQRALLEALAEDGHLDAAQLERAWAEPVRPRPRSRPFNAPHFVQTLRAEGRLARGDVTRTTLDAALQRDVEGLVRTHLSTLEQAAVDDAAVLVIDNDTAEILAWVGSADFHDPTISGQVDMVRARRQPGSTLKPFVYALAFADGLHGASMLADVPTTFAETGGQRYSPRNFDRAFAGPVSAAEALAASLNVPAVRLLDTVGPERLLDTLRALGIASLDRDATHYGLSLALGTGEVELRELAAAYATLARGGSFRPLRYTPDDPVAPNRRVLAPEIAAAVTEALADPLARVRLVPGRSPFDIGFPVAVKTGTSSGHHDAWAIGYTRERTVAVWVGNADGRAMHAVTGASGAGPLFADVMRRAMRDVTTRRPLWDPELLVPVEVCPLSGLPPGPACPRAVTRRIPAASMPDHACDVHVHAVRTPRGYACAPEGGTPVAMLPEAFDLWLQGRASPTDAYGIAWLRRADVRGCGAPVHPALEMTAPPPGDVVYIRDATTDRVELRAQVHGHLDVDEVEFVVDDQVVGRSRAPFHLLVTLGPGHHRAHARPVDPDLPIALSSTDFTVR